MFFAFSGGRVACFVSLRAMRCGFDQCAAISAAMGRPMGGERARVARSYPCGEEIRFRLEFVPDDPHSSAVLLMPEIP